VDFADRYYTDFELSRERCKRGTNHLDSRRSDCVPCEPKSTGWWFDKTMNCLSVDIDIFGIDHDQIWRSDLSNGLEVSQEAQELHARSLVFDTHIDTATHLL